MSKNAQLGFDFGAGKIETVEEIKEKENAAKKVAEELKKAKTNLLSKLNELVEFDFSKLNETEKTVEETNVDTDEESEEIEDEE